MGPTENGLKTTSPIQRRRSPFGLINGLGRNGFTLHTNSQCFTRKERALLDGQSELMEKENQFLNPRLYSNK